MTFHRPTAEDLMLFLYAGGFFSETGKNSRSLLPASSGGSLGAERIEPRKNKQFGNCLFMRIKGEEFSGGSKTKWREGMGFGPAGMHLFSPPGRNVTVGINVDDADGFMYPLLMPERVVFFSANGPQFSLVVTLFAEILVSVPPRSR